MAAYFFFFFQAEDGIRDGHVTGVQTCALPIWPRTRSWPRTMRPSCTGPRWWWTAGRPLSCEGTETMKTLTYLGPRNMELQDAPDPEPADGEVRVRITASAICGSDLHGFREASPRRIPPLVMGHEVVGTVDAAGE